MPTKTRSPSTNREFATQGERSLLRAELKNMELLDLEASK